MSSFKVDLVFDFDWKLIICNNSASPPPITTLAIDPLLVLPSPSQVDPSVFDQLPDEIKEEIHMAYVQRTGISRQSIIIFHNNH